MQSEHSSNADRLEYLYLNLIGQLVQITTIDGAVSEGIFVSRTDPETPKDEAGVFLSRVRFLRSQLHDALDPAEFSEERKLFYYKDLVMMEAAHLKIRTETPGAGKVFAYRGEHDLKAVDWAEEGNDELLEEDRNQGEWDQFEANKRFGVQSTYNEDLYTTKLDKSTIPKEKLEYAERIAREIERSGTRGVQHAAERAEMMPADMDEGTLYSDVARQPKAGPAQAGGRKGPEGTTAKGPGNKRGPVEEAPASAPPPLESPHGRDFNPNPAAVPFVPSRQNIVKDYLDSLAKAISSNENCYQCEPDWPGEDDHYDKDDSSYTQMQQGQGMMPLNQGPPAGVPPGMPPQQQQPVPGYSGGMAPPPMGQPFGRPGHGHQMMHTQTHFAVGNNVGGYGPNMHHAMGMPPQQMQYMDPNQGGPSPGQPPQQQQRMGMAPQPSRPSAGKGSQPQQPVSTPLPMHQQSQPQAPPPQQQQQQQAPPPPADSTAVPEKQPTKKLTRGVKAAQPRADAAGTSDGAPTGGKRGGK